MIGKFVVLSVLVALVKGQGIVWGVGPCPKVSVVQDFDVGAYLGQWYQIARFPNPFEKSNCSTAAYGPVTNGTVGVHNVEIVDGEESSIDGTAELADPNSTEAKLIVKFFNPDSVAPYWVLGTDYKNYTLVWACEAEFGIHVQFSWVLGRTKPLSAEASAAVDELIAANGIDGTKYEVHDLPECSEAP